MDLQAVMRTTGTVRYLRADPIPDEILYHIFDAARFAPQGGNRQPVRWVVVADPATKRQLQEWYEPAIRASFEAYAAKAGIDLAKGPLPPAARAPLHLARHFHEVPLVVFACLDAALLRPAGASPDAADLETTTLIDGGHVFPAVQNFLLACRDQGLGAALTSYLTLDQARIRALLGLPDRFLAAAAIAVGWPDRPFPTRLKRLPIEETVFLERFGVPFFGVSPP